MGIVNWYRCTFRHKTRKILLVVIAVVVYGVLAYAWGRLSQYIRDKEELLNLKQVKVELIDQISKDIDLTLENYKQEILNEDKRIKTDKLPITSDESDRIQEED